MVQCLPQELGAMVGQPSLDLHSLRGGPPAAKTRAVQLDVQLTIVQLVDLYLDVGLIILQPGDVCLTSICLGVVLGCVDFDLKRGHGKKMACTCIALYSAPMDPLHTSFTHL